jgi:hypothetical protein
VDDGTLEAAEEGTGFDELVTPWAAELPAGGFGAGFTTNAW